MEPDALSEPDSDGRGMSLVRWDLGTRTTSAVLGAMEATPKPGSHSMVRLRQLEVVQEETSIASGASRGRWVQVYYLNSLQPISL